MKRYGFRAITHSMKRSGESFSFFHSGATLILRMRTELFLRSSVETFTMLQLAIASSYVHSLGCREINDFVPRCGFYETEYSI